MSTAQRDLSSLREMVILLQGGGNRLTQNETPRDFPIPTSRIMDTTGIWRKFTNVTIVETNRDI
jgi:hypothetical protein